jgi:hypothetical protein
VRLETPSGRTTARSPMSRPLRLDSAAVLLTWLNSNLLAVATVALAVVAVRTTSPVSRR